VHPRGDDRRGADPLPLRLTVFTRLMRFLGSLENTADWQFLSVADAIARSARALNTTSI
jgi:hypothetical protein